MVKFWTEVIVKEGNLNWCGSRKFPSDKVTNGFLKSITYVVLFTFCWLLAFSDQFVSIFFCLRFNVTATDTSTHAGTHEARIYARFLSRAIHRVMKAIPL